MPRYPTRKTAKDALYDAIVAGITANAAQYPSGAGQPETREYQVQAYQNNQYVGPSSPIVAVVTLP